MHSHPSEPKQPSAAKALTHYAVWHVAVPYGIEYTFCFLTTLVVNGTLLHGRLNAPVAAIGVYAAGILSRYFLTPSKHSKPSQQQPVPFIMPASDLPPGFLDGLLAEPTKGGGSVDGNETVSKSSGPYL